MEDKTKMLFEVIILTMLFTLVVLFGGYLANITDVLFKDDD